MSKVLAMAGLIVAVGIAQSALAANVPRAQSVHSTLSVAATDAEGTPIHQSRGGKGGAGGAGGTGGNGAVPGKGGAGGKGGGSGSGRYSGRRWCSWSRWRSHLLAKHRNEGKLG